MEPSDVALKAARRALKPADSNLTNSGLLPMG